MLPICKLLPLISPIVVRDVPVIAPTFVITALVSPICKLLPLISPVDVTDEPAIAPALEITALELPICKLLPLISLLAVTEPVILTLPLIGPPVLSYFVESLDGVDHTALPDTSAAIT